MEKKARNGRMGEIRTRIRRVPGGKKEADLQEEWDGCLSGELQEPATFTCIEPQIETPCPASPTALNLGDIPESGDIDLGPPGVDSPDAMDFDTAITRAAETMAINDLSGRENWSGRSTHVATFTAQTANSTKKTTIAISACETSLNEEEDEVGAIPTCPKAMPMQNRDVYR